MTQTFALVSIGTLGYAILNGLNIIPCITSIYNKMMIRTILWLNKMTREMEVKSILDEMDVES